MAGQRRRSENAVIGTEQASAPPVWESGMNDARRKEIRRAVALIKEAVGILATAQAGEQDDFDNMPQDMQDDEQGQRAQDAADCLELAVISCDDVISNCEEAVQN
jgi:hypothetical protein